MSNQRGNTVMVGLIAAIAIPRIEQLTGVKLSIDDVAALIGLAGVVWHGAATAVERYFPPPPNPTSPPPAAKP